MAKRTVLARPRRTSRIAVQKRVAALDVHRDRRLVEHEQVGVADERDREADALRLAAGELLGAPVGDVADPGAARAPRRRRADAGRATAIISTSSRTVTSRIRAPVWSIAPTAPAVDRGLRRRPEDRDAAGVGLEQPEQHVDRRRLARAVRPEQRDGLARRDGDVDPAHGAHVAEGLGEPVQLDTDPPVHESHSASSRPGRRYG